MKLQYVADGLEGAIVYVAKLPPSDDRTELLRLLRGTRADLSRFGEAILATLDDYERQLKAS